MIHEKIYSSSKCPFSSIRHLCYAITLKNHKTRSVSHYAMMALPITLKKYLKAKEELWKFKYFTMQKI
jgi:hypothetical protein